MKTNFKKIFTVGTSIGFLSLAACSSAPQRPMPRPPAPQAGQMGQIPPPAPSQQLGVIETAPGQTQYQTKKVVIQTEQQQIPTVTQSRTGADINRMTVADFVALGLPQEQAQDVVQQRSLHGPFKSVSDLAGVPSLDPNWLDQNKDRLAVQKTG